MTLRQSPDQRLWSAKYPAPDKTRIYRSGTRRYRSGHRIGYASQGVRKYVQVRVQEVQV